MKLNYEQLIKALDAGEIVEIKRDDLYTCIGGAGKDKWGNYRCSAWHGSIEEARAYNGASHGSSEKFLRELCETAEYLDSYAWTITDQLPKGTEVYVKENAEQECKRFGFGWYDVKKNMLGKVCEIKADCKGVSSIYCDKHSCGGNFPRTAFTVYIPELEEFTEAEKQLIKDLREKGYSISKA